MLIVKALGYFVLFLLSSIKVGEVIKLRKKRGGGDRDRSKENER